MCLATCRLNKYDMIWYDIYDIFNCIWVATRWQYCSTHIHTNNTENETKQTIHRTTQTIHRTAQKIHRTQKSGRVRAVPRLCEFYPGICLTTEAKARTNLSQTLAVIWNTVQSEFLLIDFLGLWVQDTLPYIWRALSGFDLTVIFIFSSAKRAVLSG